MGIRKQILEIMEETAESFVKELKAGFSKQGHGKGDAIEQLTFESGGNEYSDINMPEHYEIVNKGIKASRIPFGKSTGQKRSDFIEGLIKHFRKHGVIAKELIGRAIATAKVMRGYRNKKGVFIPGEGMSTLASRRFSETGKRQQFIEGTTSATKEFDRMQTKVLDAVEAEANHILDLLVIN